MKKLLTLSTCLIIAYYINAQDLGVADALRFSSDEVEGTARFRAMGGAFGALGGDMSSVNINPAGSAIFNTNHASFTLGVVNRGNDTNYFGTQQSNSNTHFDMSQFGVTFLFENTNENSPWKKVTFSLAYDRTADYDEDWIASGINPNNTIGNYFLRNAQGLRFEDISLFDNESIPEAYADIGSAFGFRHQQAFLGYQGFIFDAVDENDADNTAYTPNINGGNFNQAYTYSTRGFNGKFAINLGTSYNDRLYLGANVNIHFINYERFTLLSENNLNATSTVTNVNFENNVLTTGAGFSFQLGAIAKLTEALRAGISYQSPTWYTISEETTQFLQTRVDGEGTVNVDPNTLVIFPDYRLRTPSKVTGSLAYVFNKKGLISFDYTLKDYSNIEFRPTSDTDLAFINTEIAALLDTAASYRFGGEYRVNNFSFRGGYRFEESPYKDGTFVGDLKAYSGGLGYNFGNFNIDFAYSLTQRDVNYQLFNVGLTDTILLDTSISNYMVTLGFNF